MADETRKRSRFTTALSWAVWIALPAVIAALYFLGILPAKRAGNFISCRNHTTFVGIALDRYIAEHGQLPYVPGLPGEELVCRLNFDGPAVNCHAGAPGQSYGGWQMVNASPKSWDEILRTMRTMKGNRIPVIWCGKPHRPGEPWVGTVRVVIAFGLYPPAPRSLSEFIEKEAGADTDGVRHLDYFRSSIVYGMPEEELKMRLAEINAILQKNGEPETPLNIEGGKDYWKLAEPYQTNPPP